MLSGAHDQALTPEVAHGARGGARGRVVIERSVRGPVEVLRLAHGKASALDVELLRALSQALDEASAARALGP